MSSPEKIALILGVFAILAGFHYVAGRFAGFPGPVALAQAATSVWHGRRGWNRGGGGCRHEPADLDRLADEGAEWIGLSPDQRPAFDALVARLKETSRAATDLCRKYEAVQTPAGGSYADLVAGAAGDLERVAGLVAGLAGPVAAFEAVLDPGQKTRLDALLRRR